ncbi:MAG: hypothetical protein KatS3mg120_0032 [Erythrobacter sp.]|nr:MAG: hypothetical protein KatS3mg120_0032 [Erythrobacter sp.]
MAAPALAQEPQSVTLEDARIAFDGAQVVLANSRIERRMAWNDGALATLWLGFGGSDEGWAMAGQVPDLAPLGAVQVSGEATLALRQVAATGLRPAHLELTVETAGQGVDVRRICLVFPKVPAIPCTIAYRGAPRAIGRSAPEGRDVIESANLALAPQR